MTKDRIRALADRFAASGQPVLTLYACVNPAEPKNSIHTLTVRLDETLRSLDVPTEVAERARRAILARPYHARSIVVFANSESVERIELDIDLPVVDAATGHMYAGWGKPQLVPLLAAGPLLARYAVVHVDQERWRFFEVSEGAIEEVAAAVLAEWEEEAGEKVGAPELYPGYFATRDNAGKDRAGRHLEVLTRRFYKDLAAALDEHIASRPVDGLILVGTSEQIRLFESMLPDRLCRQVIARTSSVPASSAPPEDFLAKAKKAIAEHEDRCELSILDRIRERGVSRLGPTLQALQRGQLKQVVVPWPDHRQIFVDAETGFAAETPEALAAQGLHESRPAQMQDVLPGLAADHGAQIAWMIGLGRSPLLEQFGGMGGVRRW